MFDSMRALGMWVVLISAVALSACSGGGDTVSGPSASPQNFVSAEAAMEASAVSYETQVQSFEGTMSIGFDTGDDAFSTTGEMKFEAPDKAYVSMDIPTVGEVAVLLDSPDIYFSMDGNWYKGDSTVLGIDLTDFEKYAQDRGPVDYANALKGLKDLVKLSDEKIDGKTYWHYHGSLDLDAPADEIPSDVVDPSIIGQATDVLSNTSMDIYIDPVTLLPRRYNMAMTMTFGTEFTMNMAMDFEKYNEDVHMPDAPTDYQEFDFSDSGSGY